MPKTKNRVRAEIRECINKYGSEVISITDEKIACKICNIELKVRKTRAIEKHCNSKSHKQCVERKLQNERPIPESCSSIGMDVNAIFYKDLCNMMVSANIPLYKLNNPHFRGFLEKYTNKIIPNESTLRKNYVPKCYEDKLNEIRERVIGNKIWVSIDETSDATGRYVANVVLGILLPNSAGNKFLLTTEILEKVNHSTIEALFEKSMSLLWPHGVQCDDVLLFVTDGAPYIIKAAKQLQSRYKQMVHITCLAHGLHRVAEFIREEFSDVDSFISNVKKIFRKAPSRLLKFRETAPNVPLPPNPIVTRWGTWLNAAIYYAKHYNTIRSVINTLDSEEASSISVAKSLMSEQLFESIQFIANNFGHIPNAITQLETSGLEMSRAIEIIEDVSTKLDEAVPGPITKRVKEKFQIIKKKNNGFSVLCNIRNKIKKQKQASDNELLYSFAPLTSCDVERTFSQYKNFLSDNRRNFTFKNLRMCIVLHCNANSQNQVDE